MYSRGAPRRRHGAEFNAKVLAECDEPGVSISSVALAHGLNANLVRQWRAGRGVKPGGAAVVQSAAPGKGPEPIEDAAPLIGTKPEFVAVEMPAPVRTAPGASTIPPGPTPSPSVEPLIHVELRRGPLHLSVRWPTSAGDDCRAWLRDLSLDLLK
jgi:transposase